MEYMNNKDIKVAVCCIACQENDYIREWVEYYKNLGVDKCKKNSTETFQIKKF